MITRQEAVRRLEEAAREITALKEALAEEADEAPAAGATEAFLAKCGGWEDNRSPEEIIAEIYAARSGSDRAAAMFPQKSE